MTVKTYDTTVPAIGGGIVVKTISANPTVISSVACRDCYVTAAVGSTPNTGVLLVALGSACLTTGGFPVPAGAKSGFSVALTTVNTPTPLYFAIHSLSALSFCTETEANLDRVAIIYRT